MAQGFALDRNMKLILGVGAGMLALYGVYLFTAPATGTVPPSSGFGPGGVGGGPDTLLLPPTDTSSLLFPTTGVTTIPNASTVPVVNGPATVATNIDPNLDNSTPAMSVTSPSQPAYIPPPPAPIYISGGNLVSQPVSTIPAIAHIDAGPTLSSVYLPPSQLPSVVLPAILTPIASPTTSAGARGSTASHTVAL